MPASQEQKVDFLLKKIGYSASKTGIAEDSSLTGSTKKAPFAEAIPSPLIVPKSSVWSDSGFIPTTPPTSNTTYVGIYTAANAYRMTYDNSVGAARRSFIARSTYGNQSASIDGDWIDTQFGADYIVKVYKGDPNSGGVSLQQAGGNAGTDGWFFDYSSGVLNFNGNNLPSGIGTDNVYILGYRYTGAKGLQPPAGIGTFRDLVVTNNFKVGGISTFSGLIDANGIIEGIAGQNKIPSLYANYTDLPNAGTYHGMFAHVHGTQKGYFAHAGGWYELVNKETTGTVGTGTERYNIGALDATSLKVTGITTLGSIGISTGRIIGPSVTYIDPATVGAAGTVVILGNLQVDGTQTTVNSSTMTVTDKNIEVAKGAANDAAADGAGITVDAGSNADKTWQWLDSTDSWTSSEHIRIPDGKVFGFASDTNTYMGRPAADSFGFTFGGTEMVRMGYVPSIAGGGIGINRTSIGARLHIQHDGNGALRHMVKLANNGAGQGTGAQINMGASTADEQYSASIAGFYDNPGTSFIIKTAGTYANQSTVAERLRVQHDGKVGIGTVLPTSNLHVANYSGDATIEIESGSTASSILRFGDTDNNDVGQIKYNHSDNSLGLYTANTNERVRIDSSGNTNVVGIITANNFDYFDRGNYLSNIKLGHDVGNANLVSNGAQFNILIGYRTGYSLTSGDNAVMIGANAGRNVTTATGGVYVGFNAGRYNQSGTSCVYVGSETGSGTVHSGNNNTFVGAISGKDRIGSNNTLFGYYAGRGIGNQTNNGDKLSFFGSQAGQKNVSGDQNSGFGYFTLHNNQSGDKNSGFGNEALKDTTGNYNSAFGADAGKNLTSGANNLILGYNAQASTNSTSNEITLGDTNVTKFRIPGIGVTLTDGIVTIPTPVIDIDGDVTVGGNFKVVGVSTFSDDVTFTGASYSVLWDKSENALEFSDDARATFGDSKQLKIYRNSSGSTSTIENTQNILNISNTGTHTNIIASGNIYLKHGTNHAIVTRANAEVELYHNSSEKLATTSTGINVIGLTETDTLTTGNATFTGSVSAGSTTGIDGYYLKSTGIGVTWAVLPSSRTGLTTTATAGQTSFNFSYNVGFVDVFLNGVKLPSTEFTASNGSTIVLDDAAFANDTLEFISLNTVPVSSAGTLSDLTDVNITSPVVGQALRYNGVKFVNDYHPHSTTTSTSQVSITNLPIASYRSAEYTVQITQGTKYHVTKILAIHDGTNVTFNEYGTLTTHSSLATFTLDINSGSMRLLATPASTNSTTFKVKFDAITV